MTEENHNDAGDRFETGDWVRINGELCQLYKYRVDGVDGSFYLACGGTIIAHESNTDHWEKVDMSNAYDVLSTGPI